MSAARRSGVEGGSPGGPTASTAGEEPGPRRCVAVGSDSVQRGPTAALGVPVRDPLRWSGPGALRSTPLSGGVDDARRCSRHPPSWWWPRSAVLEGYSWLHVFPETSLTVDDAAVRRVCGAGHRAAHPSRPRAPVDPGRPCGPGGCLVVLVIGSVGDVPPRCGYLGSGSSAWSRSSWLLVAGLAGPGRASERRRQFRDPHRLTATGGLAPEPPVDGSRRVSIVTRVDS